MMITTSSASQSASEATAAIVDAWPIAAAMLQYPAVLPDGRKVQDESAEHWRDTLLEISELGFSHVDITDSWLRIGDLTAPRISELLDVLTDVGLKVPAVSTARRSVIDPINGEDNLDYCHRVIAAAPTIGAGVVSVGLFEALTAAQLESLWFWTVPGAGNQDDDETWSVAVRRLQELGDHAREIGIELSLEMYEGTYLGSADSAVRLVTEIDRDNVGLNPDLGNLLRQQSPIESWQYMLDKTLPFANYWHVKNYFRSENPADGLFITSPAPLDLGVMNYREAVRTAVASGYRGAFCIEHYGGDGLAIMARNRTYLKELLRDAVRRSPIQSRLSGVDAI